MRASAQPGSSPDHPGLAHDSWASPSDFSSSATRFVMLSFSPVDQRSKVINKDSRSTSRTQGLVLTVRLLQSSAESIPLLLHSHEGCGSLHQLAIKRLWKEQDINLRPTILVTHIFGGYSHRERCSRTRYRSCRTELRDTYMVKQPSVHWGRISSLLWHGGGRSYSRSRCHPPEAPLWPSVAVCSNTGAEVCSISEAKNQQRQYGRCDKISQFKYSQSQKAHSTKARQWLQD